MSERIEMSELQRKLDDPNTDPAELAKYLRPDPVRSKMTSVRGDPLALPQPQGPLERPT
jgi:hypothetical protein